MNQKALKTLEYDKIIEQLASYASSPLGRKKCLELVPSSSLSQITRMQHETHDALTRLFKKGHISFGDAKDIRGALKRLEIGSSMNITELLQTAALLENTARVKAYGRRENADQTPDSLEDLFETLEPLTLLSTEIRRCILSEDEISDDASPNLRRIRRSIKSCEEKIHSQLISLVNGSYRTYLQDAVITMRDGRYCIPIKSEYKGQVPGMVHDQSSTGSTFFVEPMAVVKLNNDIRELENLDRIPAELGGDLYLVNGNMLPLSQVEQNNAYASGDKSETLKKEETTDEEQEVLEVDESGTGNRAGRRSRTSP